MKVAWKRFIRSLSGVDRCGLNWGSGRILLEVYQGWIDAASTADLEEVYDKFISGGQMQPQLWMWKRFIIYLLKVEKCSLSWRCERGLIPKDSS